MSLLVSGSFANAAGESKITNGDFQAGPATSPEGWHASAGCTFETDSDGNRFLRLTVVEPGKSVTQHRQIKLSPQDKALELTYRVRYSKIEVGAKSWFDGRVIVNFKDADGAIIPGPTPPSFKGTRGDWRDVKVQMLVPEKAVTIEIMPTLFNAKAGELDVDDLRLVAVDPASVPKPINMDSPIVPVPPRDKWPRELHVYGNRIVDSDGKEVWLQGLCVDSLEWKPTGDRVVHSIGVAIDEWKSNCIRLPVKETLWFGKLDTQNDGGAAYRQLVDSCVNATVGKGAWLVIDLHNFRALKAEHMEFWKDIATRYKNHPGVIFELFNEPYGITWDVWRNGGTVTDKPKQKEGVAQETTEGMTSFEAVGTQQAIDTIRQLGARNIIIAGALDFSYDLSGILKGYELVDTSGNGIVYSSHVYPWKRDWQGKFLDVAAKHPIFIGEVGCPDKWDSYKYIPQSQRFEPLGPGCTWPVDMIAVIQKHRLNWTAFAFHPKCGPEVISDWNYTPTPAWGVFVKEALNGKKFESDRLR